jgi:hypothetical protein
MCNPRAVHCSRVDTVSTYMCSPRAVHCSRVDTVSTSMCSPRAVHCSRVDTVSTSVRCTAVVLGFAIGPLENFYLA